MKLASYAEKEQERQSTAQWLVKVMGLPGKSDDQEIERYANALVHEEDGYSAFRNRVPGGRSLTAQLLRVFRKLYEANPEVRERMHAGLAKVEGSNRNVVHNFFLTWGDSPEVRLVADYLPAGARNKRVRDDHWTSYFIVEANHLMYQELQRARKAHLGIKDKD